MPSPGGDQSGRDDKADNDDDGDDELEDRQAKDRAHYPKHGMAGDSRDGANLPTFPPEAR